MQKQEATTKNVGIAITALGLLASIFLAGATAQAQSGRGSLRISFVLETRFQLHVDQAVGKVAVKAPGTSATFPGSTPNYLSLDAALAEHVGASKAAMTPTNKPAGEGSASAVNLVIFAK